MEKQGLVNILDTELKPLGFKRKGNYWFCDTQEIIKIVDLQRSRFSKSYFINYGFNVKSISQDDSNRHTYIRLFSGQNNSDTDLLDLENVLSDNYRKACLKEAITTQLSTLMQSIDSESDVLKYIKTLPNTNMIPLVVKSHFNLT